MIVAVVLGLYALSGAVALPRLLVRGDWAERAPRLAIAMWHAACASVLTSAVLAVLAAAIPASVVGHGIADLLEACAALLSDGAAVTPTGLVIAAASGGLVGGRLAYCAAVVLLKAKRERREHAEMLCLLGKHDSALGAVVLDHIEPIAYCLPGGKGKMVITTGALRSLPPEEVAAVLAHEQAHLQGRHHLVVAAGEILSRAFPYVPLFRRARSETARLIELQADDVAARRHARIHIASALVRLATGRVPAFSMGMGGENALTRVRRMLGPETPLNRHERLATVAAVGLLLAGPAAVALTPGVSAFLAHHCHELLPR
ncbi:M56 family metallopeptidase [Sphaerisporangium perillae]|uniref:M56 family metallopeptidase n=1 Tax=Sphaerisporangium perillae TaxID=2935860 RepID=UPI00200EE67E|nr:M56 family metallopeptidase [Sphaerisporangium perillae]